MKATIATIALLSLALCRATPPPRRVHALLVHGYDGPLPYKLTEKACDMAAGQDVIVVAGTHSEMYGMADALRARCAPALGGGAKVRVLPWLANNTAEHVQCAAKLLHLSSAPHTDDHVILTQVGFEHVMPRLQRTTVALRNAGADAEPFFGRATLLYAGLPTPAVDAWRAHDEIRYNSTAAIEGDVTRARTGPCAWAACRVDEL